MNGPMTPLSQLFACWTLGLRRLARSKFFLGTVIASALPLVLTTIIGLNRPQSSNDPLELASYLDHMARTFYLHFVVFFTATVLGFAALRQEIDDRTLHYLLLQPSPRWAILAGRYLSVVTLVLGCVVASLWLNNILAPLLVLGAHGPGEWLLQPGRVDLLLRQTGVLGLAVAAYSAIGVLAGSFLKTQGYALLLILWELTLPYMPATLKPFALTHYFHSLLPRASESAKLFELLGEPAPRTQSLVVPLTIVLIALVLAFGIFQFKEPVESADT